MNAIMVRWTDKQGREQSKEYENEKMARKARDWLIDNGAEDVDIAIVVKLKPQVV